jgi:hypothetical protein
LRFEERFLCREREAGLKTVSERHSAMPFMKQMQFESLGDERTRVHLRFSYTPPLGVVGDALASAVGCNAKAVLTELLMRAKFFLETGREPHDAVSRRGGRQRRSPHEADTGTKGQRGGQFTPAARDSERHADADADTPRSSSTAQVGWKLPHGPGAPMDDVARPGIYAGDSVLDPAHNLMPEPTPAGSQFPPAV